jgi:hypothetical protein
MLNEQAAKEGKQVSTALQMALLNCCVTVGQQVCTMFLAAIESRIALDQALLIGFMLAAVSFGVAGIATLFLDDSGGAPAEGQTAEVKAGAIAQEMGSVA